MPVGSPRLVDAHSTTTTTRRLVVVLADPWATRRVLSTATDGR